MLLRESDYRYAALAIIKLIENAEEKELAKYMAAGEALAVQWEEAAERQADGIDDRHFNIWQKLVALSQPNGKSA